MRRPRTILALAGALASSMPVGLVSQSTAAAGFTLLYSADERGEITPCG